MNAAKLTLTATVLTAAMGLALGLMAAPALADKPTDGCHVAHEDCPPAGGDETTSGGKHSALIFTLTDTANLENDEGGDYVHNEGHVKALAGGQNERHRPGLLLSLRGGGRNPRTWMVSADCIDTGRVR